MRFGFGINVRQSESTTALINSNDGITFYLKVAGTAEELEYDSYWQSDHWILPNNDSVFDCWSILASIATQTRKLRLGSFVTPLVSQNPFCIGKRVLTSQAISNGRIIFGVGFGWNKPEYDAFGISFPSYKKRVSMLSEALELLRMSWASEESVDYNGVYYQVKGLVLKPSTKRPPIWFGGSSESTLRVVSQQCDGWIPYELHPDDYKSKLNRLYDLLDQQQRKSTSITTGLGARIIARKTDKEADDFVRSHGLSRDFKNVWGQRGHLIFGSYEKCVEELSCYIDAGVNYFVLTPQPTNETIELMKSLRNEVIVRL